MRNKNVPIGKISTVFKVYDAMMGSGKTTQIIENIRTAEKDQNFLYITPLLDECHRISGTTYDPEDTLKRPLITTETILAFITLILMMLH